MGSGALAAGGTMGAPAPFRGLLPVDVVPRGVAGGVSLTPNNSAQRQSRGSGERERGSERGRESGE